MKVGDRPSFDEFAEEYDRVLAQGLSITGEKPEFFAKGRVSYLARSLEKYKARPRKVMDFGCGTGLSIPYLLNLSDDCCLTGVDISARSLEIARRNLGSPRTQFALVQDYKPTGDYDLVFCNGVFHHVLLRERAAMINFIFQSLKNGGWFALWENNPWNPGSHYVMHRTPFDRGAIKLSYHEARRLLQIGGFEVVSTNFLFYSPHFLRCLRPLEKWLTHLPLGAQYQVLCRKPYPPT